MELIELLEKLTAAFGPSGCEDGVRGVIADLIAPYVDEVRTDAMGSLIAHKKGEGKKGHFMKRQISCCSSEETQG